MIRWGWLVGDMIKPTFFLALFALVLSDSVSARAANNISIGTDSITWAVEGYSLIASYENDRQPKLRYHAEVFGIRVPDAYLDGYEPNTGEGWQRSIDWAAMLTVDHHPFRGLPGLHWGAGFNVQQSTLNRAGMSPTTTFETFEPIVRIGYQWFPFGEGLFVSPYAAVGIPLHLSEPDPIGGETFEEGWLLPVASIQLGWRFPL